MSTSTEPQSRDRILNSLHEITGLNIEDCIPFLEQYNWNLQDVVQDFYSGKDFGKKPISNSNEKNDKNGFQQASTNNNNLGNFYAKNDRKHHAVEDDDRYYAEILHIYGDSDESARKHGTQGQQQYNRQPQQQQHHQQTEQQYQRQVQQQPARDAKVEPIYHEKQQFLRCGIHSLNNLFQIPHLFTHEHLDRIVREYDKSYINNDYGKLWIGDYDLRILIEAITRCGYQVQQINFYHTELQYRPWDSYFGLLINLNGAHWFTIKNLNGIYHNLDSTFSKPTQIGQKDALVQYLIRLIHKFKNVYIFAVLQQANRTDRS